ncbi:hypothetical protein ACO1O0_003029 [Amphichorda felina]
MATVLSGAAFGAAMLASGFHHPSVVISQLRFDNWHMFQAFITATAASAAIYSVAERLGYVSLKPRSNSPLGLFAKYDGNIIGGALLGAGMALSGSCPGTLLAQIGAGVRSGLFTLQGALLGGIIWSGFLSRAVKARNEKAGTRTDTSTLSEQLGLSRCTTVTAFEMACIAFVATTTLLATPASEPKILGAVGGLLIATAQLISIVTRRTMMGVSGSYEDFGKHFWSLLGGADSAARPGFGNMVFAAGMCAGSFALAKAVPELVGGPVTEISPVLATVGGAIMVIGSRMAGGCTSGHGISGISLLSTSSVITIASAFAAGGAVASTLL